MEFHKDLSSGPILFVIYINRLLATVARGSQVYLFRDNTKIYRKITSNHDCQELQDIDSLYEWTKTSLLTFHPNKCKYMHIGPKQNIPDHHYTLGPIKYPLEKKTTTEKDISVTFICRLTFENRMNEKISRTNSILAIIIIRIFEYLDKNNFLHTI